MKKQNIFIFFILMGGFLFFQCDIIKVTCGPHEVPAPSTSPDLCVCDLAHHYTGTAGSCVCATGYNYLDGSCISSNTYIFLSGVIKSGNNILINLNTKWRGCVAYSGIGITVREGGFTGRNIPFTVTKVTNWQYSLTLSTGLIPGQSYYIFIDVSAFGSIYGGIFTL